jgi:stalled ribosome rescue protein Dom34
MPHHFHAVVCIDHAEALVLEFAESGVTEHRIRTKDRHGNIHHKAGSAGSGHTHDSKAYLTAVADALASVPEILVIGHGSAKDEFASFIKDHVPALAPRIMGVETVDHPTKGEILAFARKFFEAKDRMTPQLSTPT